MYATHIAIEIEYVALGGSGGMSGVTIFTGRLFGAIR